MMSPCALCTRRCCHNYLVVITGYDAWVIANGLRLAPEQLAALAASAGFDVFGLRTQLEQWDFGSRAGLLGFCSAGFGAWTERLPSDRRDAFVCDVLDRYLASRYDVAETVFRFYQTDLALTVV